jgi:hypothetical protein
VSLYLFDRERVPGVSVILAIVVVWGWLDAVEIVVGRSDFEDLSRGGSCGLKLGVSPSRKTDTERWDANC